MPSAAMEDRGPGYKSNLSGVIPADTCHSTENSGEPIFLFMGGGPSQMDRFDPKAPALPKQWVGATAAAAADYAARILTNYLAGEGMEVVQRRYLLENKP